MSQTPGRIPGKLQEALDRTTAEALGDVDHQLPEADLADLRRQVRDVVARHRTTDVEYEIKFLSIVTIRYKARIGATLTTGKLFVLFLPAIMLVLATGGAAFLFWLIGPRLLR